MRLKLSFLLPFLFFSCQTSDEIETAMDQSSIELTPEQAERLAKLPLNCIQTPFPYKSGIVIAKAEDLNLPQVHHPAFYGCFDWHSAVHGHWVLVNLLKHYPTLSTKDSIRQKLRDNLTANNIQIEIEYFSMNQYSKSFERTYGWAWFLKLAEELHNWDDPDAKKWFANLKPLADTICQKYLEYLPKLNYPIRVGEHTNTAFGLTFAFDYAKSIGHTELLQLIEERAITFYTKDEGCPANWEPSGYDFLSPCLEEADIMRRVLSKAAFKEWFTNFLPQLINPNKVVFRPAKVSDRSDGKLVHLDGLNFSRAWCLYNIVNDYPEWNHLIKLADEHIAFSLPNIVDGDYAGEHWLGTFALYALNAKSK
ncbi:MAG: DUF2891 domain-containing protein [Bacteroidetes bacterium]|nr:DUF2891 domain-containing protein [Bacteroidota bacterium]